jgi:hypothetical protein
MRLIVKTVNLLKIQHLTELKLKYQERKILVDIHVHKFYS